MPTNDEWAFFVKFAETMSGEGGLKPLAGKSTPMILAVVQKGFELGLTPMEALENVYVVDNSLYVNSFIMRANAQKNGVRIEKADEGPEHCTVRITRPDMPDRPFEYTYTISMAKKAGVVRSGGNWEKYPDRMLFARAARNALRDYCADLIGAANYIEPEEREELESQSRARVVAQDGIPVPDPFRDPIDPAVVDQVHDSLGALIKAVALEKGVDAAKVSAKVQGDFATWKARELGINKTEEAHAADVDKLWRYVAKRYKGFGVAFSGPGTGGDGAATDDVQDVDFEAVHPAVIQLKAKWHAEGLTDEERTQVLVTASAVANSVIEDIDNATDEQILAMVQVTQDVLMARDEAAGQQEEPEPEPDGEPDREQEPEPSRRGGGKAQTLDV